MATARQANEGEFFESLNECCSVRCPQRNTSHCRCKVRWGQRTLQLDKRKSRQAVSWNSQPWVVAKV